MSKDDRLSTYRSKRDFGATEEPRGGAASRDRREQPDHPQFVIQRHDASSLHFDFRLEIDGVLVSWAVPKGPSTDPRDKRLAVRTEDHPLEYVDFEGAIAEGEYGAGTVVVWDTGSFRNLTERRGRPVAPGQAIEDGHIKVWLDGTKLTGGFALSQTHSWGGQEQWLLVKVDDDGADRRRRPTTTQPESVLTGRTNTQVGDEERAEE